MARNLSTPKSWRSWLGVFSLGLLLVLSCTQERFKGVDPVDVGRGRPDRVLVLLKDGTSLELRGPSIRNDTLVGRGNSGTTEIALGNVAQIQVPLRRFSPAATIGLVISGGVAIWFVYQLSKLSGD